MTHEEKMVAEKFKSYKRQKRNEMVKALITAGYTCNEIAVVFNLSESSVRSCVYGDDSRSQN